MFYHNDQENAMGSAENFVENADKNDAWEWNDAHLNEAFSEENSKI